MGGLTLVHSHPMVVSFLTHIFQVITTANIRSPSLVEEHVVLTPPNKDLRVVKVFLLTPHRSLILWKVLSGSQLMTWCDGKI
jgi:hypothetical protein